MHPTKLSHSSFTPPQKKEMNKNPEMIVPRTSHAKQMDLRNSMGRL